MNVLAVGAHPDDIEYGCGGTLLRHKNHKDRIYLFVLTGGEESGGYELREKEQKMAAEFLEVKEIFWGGFKDTELPVGSKLISRIDEIIKKTSPDVIYVNYPDDAHQDHRACSECTITAARYIKKVLFYEDYTTRNFEPSVFVDIGNVLKDKVKLLSFHRSQVERTYPTGLDMLESVRSIASFRGFQAKTKYAEGFASLRYMINPNNA